jgi:DDE_Tnp_1-associated
MPAIVKPIGLIETHFGNLRDPRALHSILHKLLDILIITICAVICGADNFVEVDEYGKEKEEWLKTFLELRNGIPSVDKDTFERIFGRHRKRLSALAYYFVRILRFPLIGFSAIASN